MKKVYDEPEILIEEFICEDVMADSTVTDFNIDEDFFFQNQAGSFVSKVCYRLYSYVLKRLAVITAGCFYLSFQYPADNGIGHQKSLRCQGKMLVVANN